MHQRMFLVTKHVLPSSHFEKDIAAARGTVQAAVLKTRSMLKDLLAVSLYDRVSTSILLVVCRGRNLVGVG